MYLHIYIFHIPVRIHTHRPTDTHTPMHTQKTPTCPFLKKKIGSVDNMGPDIGMGLPRHGLCPKGR